MPVLESTTATLTGDRPPHLDQRAAVTKTGYDTPARVVATVEGRGGVRWQNWARSQECRPERIFYPGTVGELQAIVRATRRTPFTTSTSSTMCGVRSCHSPLS
jgi:hypothetical protein